VPSVPRYSLPQVEEAARPKVRASTDAPISNFGGGQAAANLTRATVGAIDAVMKAKDDADETVANNELLAARDKRYQLTLGENGALSKKGKDAADTYDKYAEEYETYGNEVMGKFANDNQRNHFKFKFDQEQAGLHEDLRKHSFKEAQAFEDETSMALVKSYQQEGLLNYTNVDKIRKSIMDQEIEIEKQGARNGKAREVIDLEKSEATSTTQLGVVRSYLASGNDITAKKYYEANVDSLSQLHKNELIEELKLGSIKGESQRLSNQIYAQYPNSLTDSVKEAKKIADPDVQDATIARIKDNFNIKEAADRERSENLHKRATDTIDSGGGIDKIPESDWKQFTLSERSALKSYAATRSKGTEPETSWDDYYSLKGMASSPKRKEEYLKLNLMTYRSKMADTEFKELVNLQTDLRDGKGSAEKLLDGYRTDASIVDGALRGMGYKPNTKNADEISLQNKFRRLVDERLIQYQQQHGKKATNTETQAIVDKLSIQVVTEKGFIWDDKKRLFELPPEKIADIDIDDVVVPDTDRAEIEATLKRKGIDVNDKVVKDWYLKWRGGY
jgi:hypothetical protein